MVRYLLDADPVAVYCEEHNPSWSWYAGGAAATAVFELTGGRPFTYVGSWASPGPTSSWNGSWRLSGSHGTALWDGENPAVVHLDGAEKVLEDAPGPGKEIVGSLAEFVDAVRTGRRPMGEVRDNLLSLAMVFAAVQSAETRRRVAIADVLS
jgi:predicted dehydrogenase